MTSDTYADLADILPDQFGTIPGTATFSVGSRYYAISVTLDARWGHARWRLGRLVGGDPMAFGYSETVEQSWRVAAQSVPRATGAAITAADFEPAEDGACRLDGGKVIDRAGDVMPTGINVDRMEWVRELQRSLEASSAVEAVAEELIRVATSADAHADGDGPLAALAREIVALVTGHQAVADVIDRAMTAAHDQALADATVYDPDDETTWPYDGQGVAVEMMFMSTASIRRCMWVSLTGDYEAIEATAGDRWLWRPPSEATDG